MIYESIRYFVRDEVATITLNRFNSKNSLTAQMRAELLDAVKRAEGEARVLVITGTGDVFSAGIDLGADTLKAADIEGQMRVELTPLLLAMRDCKIPIIAAVNGAASGTGANLALAADITIAKQSATFQQASISIGLLPDAGGTSELPRRLGLARAMGLALLGEKITAQKAEQWGLIWESVPDDDFIEVVYARAHTLANGPTQTYRLIRKAMHASFEQPYADQLETEAVLQGKASRSKDFVEGVTARLEGRSPKFQGR